VRNSLRGMVRLCGGGIAAWAVLFLIRLDTVTAQETNATDLPPVICDEFAQCCYSNCECEYCWRHDAVCQVDVPAYGQGTTMINGEKRCPNFQKDSPVCTSSSCYFWTKDSGGKTYTCASSACDLIIVDYCTGLGYIHPSKQQATFASLTSLDLGCAPMARLGIAPYSDWGQERDVDMTPATASAWPAAYTTRAGIADAIGVASYFQIEFTLSSAPDLGNFRTNLAEAVGLEAFFVAVTGSGSAVTAKVYTGNTGIAASRITTDAYVSQTTMNSYTISSNTYSYEQVTSSCYCKNPPDDCGAGYDAGSPTCTVDNITSQYKTSTDARSGIASLGVGDFSKAGDLMVGGIVVGSVLAGSLGVIWVTVMHA